MQRSRTIALMVAVLVLGTWLLTACGIGGKDVAVTGTLKAVDASAGTVAVAVGGGDLVLKLTSETKILAGGEPATVSELATKIGSEVSVEYVSDTKILTTINF